MLPKPILITGANRGIGFSILQALATRSPTDHYLLAARTTESGKSAIQELRKSGVQAEIDVVELDVANGSSMKAAERVVWKQYERLDDLVNNAGIAILERGDGSNIQESYPETFDTNITGVALMMTTFLPSHEGELFRRPDYQRLFRSRLSPSIVNR